MRLDSVGRPPNLEQKGNDVPNSDKLKVESVKGVTSVAAGEQQLNSGQQFDKGTRLGKILSMIKRAEDKKKKSDKIKGSRSAVVQALKVYEQMQQDESPVAHLGQGVNVII